MKNYGKKIMEKLVSLEPNPKRLIRSTLLGIFLAFSPFLGLQTPLAFVLAFLLRLNFAVATIMIWTVNNPWIMVPIAGLEYVVGQWLMETVFGVNLMPYNPSWMTWLNNKIGFITEYLGIKEICLWYFLIGGILVSLLACVIAYPFVRAMSYKLIEKYSHPKSATINKE